MADLTLGGAVLAVWLLVGLVIALAVGRKLRKAGAGAYHERDDVNKQKSA